ncbi:MAG: hypothetical protein AAGI68_07360 [Planctomycetota bacterium]
MPDPHARPSRDTRLPDEFIRPATPRGLAWVVGLAVVTVAVLNVAAYGLLQVHDPNRFRVIMGEKWELIESSEPGSLAGVGLVLGDSSANQGLDPAVLAEATGTRWLNLGTIADLMLLDGTWMLHRHIELHGPPSRVVLMHTWDGWSREIDTRAFAQPPLSWGYWDRVEPRLPLNLVERVRMAKMRYLPLYSASTSLQQDLMFPWKVGKDRPPLTADGFMPVTVARPDRVDLDVVSGVEALQEWANQQPRAEVATAINLDALASVMALADEHGFPVYFVHAPAYAGLAAEPTHGERVDALVERLSALERQYPRFRVVFERPKVFPRTDMADTTDHLLAEPAARFTSSVAERIVELEGPAPAARARVTVPEVLQNARSGDGLP